MATTGPTLTFVETRVFTKRVTSLELEGSLRDLQIMLLNQPDAGDLDPGTGGVRKGRIPDPGRGKGKSGGARVHYLWLPQVAMVYFLFVYTKDEASTLSPDQKSQLRTVVRAIKAEWARKE